MVMSMKPLALSECRSVCPVANALDVLGDRWTLLVIRDLMLLNKHEYHEFLKGSEGIATNILSDRLKRLCGAELIQCRPHPTHKTKKIYYLTDKGKGLLPLMVEMILWGGTYFASPSMPKARFQKIKHNPKRFMRDVRQALKIWEETNISRVSS